jgi:hypothetical protein
MRDPVATLEFGQGDVLLECNGALAGGAKSSGNIAREQNLKAAIRWRDQARRCMSCRPSSDKSARRSMAEQVFSRIFPRSLCEGDRTLLGRHSFRPRFRPPRRSRFG